MHAALEIGANISGSVGGNQGISYGGLPINATTGNPYQDADGGRSMRLITPNGDGTAAWSETTPMTTRRWYPTLETLEDGSIIIIGGDDWGGYVNDAGQNNPTCAFPSPFRWVDRLTGRRQTSTFRPRATSPASRS